jgi:hypothetical protein
MALFGDRKSWLSGTTKTKVVLVAFVVTEQCHYAYQIAVLFVILARG